MPVVIVGALPEDHFDNLGFGEFGRVVENGVLGGSARTLGDLLGHEVEVPVLLTDGVLTDDGTGVRVEKTLLVLGEETLADSLLDNHFHELRVVLEVTLADVLEAIEDLFNFIF